MLFSRQKLNILAFLSFVVVVLSCCLDGPATGTFLVFGVHHFMCLHRKPDPLPTMEAEEAR